MYDYEITMKRREFGRMLGLGVSFAWELRVFAAWRTGANPAGKANGSTGHGTFLDLEDAIRQIEPT